jgi:hypothetical protein
LGYSQPIGGVVAYREHVSPSGVGYDIGCGNKAVLTDLVLEQVQPELPRLMDEIVGRISFGVGRNDGRSGDHAVIDEIGDAAFVPQRSLRELAAKQLGTVGAGNHYVDLFADEQDRVWVGVHFGSRGFGHKTASGFLALAQGLPFDVRASEGEMEAPPTLLEIDSELGAGYIEAMRLAGRYAYSGRDVVCEEVCRILGAARLEGRAASTVTVPPSRRAGADCPVAVRVPDRGVLAGLVRGAAADRLCRGCTGGNDRLVCARSRRAPCQRGDRQRSGGARHRLRRRVRRGHHR